MQRRDSMATALIWSLALHLVVGVTAHLWWPATESPPTVAPSATTLELTLASPPTPAAPIARSHQTATVKAEPPVHADVVAAAVPPSINLNPAPLLSEPFKLELSTLALKQPMAPQQRSALESALNQVAGELPPWTDGQATPTWRDGTREYTLERMPAADAVSLERALLRVSMIEGGQRLEAVVPVTRMAFSHFAQVVDRWNPEVDLAGDRIDGRFHANSSLYVSARAGAAPTITGPTTVAGRVVIEGRGHRDAIFTRGLDTRVPRMSLPQQPLDVAAFSGGDRLHRIEQNGRLVFLSNGGYHWQPSAAGAAPRQVQPDGYPWLIQAGEGVELEVEGEVRGHLVVYAPRRISISGNLRYARDPRQGASADFLGLVSQGNVEIASPHITGPGDIDVHAVIFAGAQFRVRHYRSEDGGMLRVLGSVTAGSLSATEPRFRTVLEFDQRLEQQRPAHFPMTDRYRIDAGELLWTVAGGHDGIVR